MAELSVVGKSILRKDALEKVTGKAAFCTDIKLPGMLHMKVLRSPYPHARILSIDTSETERVPGVRCVATGKDAPDKRFGIGLIKDLAVLEKDTVRYIGMPVAAVAAETVEAAEEGVERIKVKYEELPAVFDPEEAMRPDCPVVIHPDFPKYEKWVPDARLVPDRPNVLTYAKLRKGDMEKGFQEADLVMENRFSTGRMQHCPLEPHGVVVRPETNGGLTLFTGRQDIWTLRGVIAAVYGIKASKVRVVQQYVGGAFGGKLTLSEVIPALLALKTGQPVKWTYTREEEFIDGAHKHDHVVYIKDGVKRDGTIVARELKTIENAGAYDNTTTISSAANSYPVVGDYMIPNLKCDCYGVYTNGPPACAFRGFGITDIIWALESHMDMLAERLGISPVEIRRKNLLKEGEPNAMGELTHSNATEECIDKVVQFMDVGQKCSQDGPWRIGRGFAIGNKYGTAPTVNGAKIKIMEDGGIIIYHNADEIGQGCNMALAQIAAEEFGISVDDVEVVFSDTSSTPYFAEGSTSSRVTYNIGNAIRMACNDVKRILFQRVAERLGSPPEALEVSGKVVYDKSKPSKTVRIRDLFITHRGKDPTLYGAGGEMIGCATFVQDFIPEDVETGQLDPVLASQGGRARAFCTHIAKAVEVTVNIETGQTKVLRFVSAFDIGKAVNPKMCEQQVESGIAMGIGSALYEEKRTVNGLVTNPNFTDYRVPSTIEIPPPGDMKTTFVESAPHKDGPYGVKGIGEATMVSTEPAIGNAIYNAIGVRMKDLPITAERILAALEAKKG